MITSFGDHYLRQGIFPILQDTKHRRATDGPVFKACPLPERLDMLRQNRAVHAGVVTFLNLLFRGQDAVGVVPSSVSSTSPTVSLSSLPAGKSPLRRSESGSKSTTVRAFGSRDTHRIPGGLLSIIYRCCRYRRDSPSTSIRHPVRIDFGGRIPADGTVHRDSAGPDAALGVTTALDPLGRQQLIQALHHICHLEKQYTIPSFK